MSTCGVYREGVGLVSNAAGLTQEEADAEEVFHRSNAREHVAASKTETGP